MWSPLLSYGWFQVPNMGHHLLTALTCLLLWIWEIEPKCEVKESLTQLLIWFASDNLYSENEEETHEQGGQSQG